ncbi:quinone-dependent dihydroorotate dehydrogenase [Candidatus Symbiobacter mobilis]|uniref:Dihydroorotate dehydrogenase (quinone) n=1 Tax=Candidatus Symbiobacter mobilis CR TaxID=946483 RepID=U5N6J6_9BURK|nr:quinone-dependent dihydroorotate dehydrogenase [Candidatus Symbiobacter mobilis]AGX87161.1 dihydroorotate oxidase [Candidatus Symbiobacter mobilis CR]
MAPFPYALLRPWLFQLDPECAHTLMMGMLERTQHTVLRHLYAQRRVEDPIRIAGLCFPNRVGLAAGLDKDARCIDALCAMGFGFVEVGTVTPVAQPGNPCPRMFRLPTAQALINRMGFNNDGLAAFVDHVTQSRHYLRRLTSHPTAPPSTIVGLNIGKNAHTPIEHAVQDYLRCMDTVFAHADYVCVNISSPNTHNLRDLQRDAALDALLGALCERRSLLAQRMGRHVPIFLKIAPDLDAEQLDAIARTLRQYGCDTAGNANDTLGVIATNTTLDRSNVAGLAHAQEAGGLSGAPLRHASNQVVSQLRKLLGPTFPIIGVGGILCAEDAVEKIDAGADLIQLYTGLLYNGPALVGEAASAIHAACRARP